MIEEIKQLYNDRDNMEETTKTPSVCIFSWDEKRSIPKYTIAIPTYNRTDLLKYALESSIHQEGFDDYEILVVDNNPERDDATERFMMQYKDHPKVAYYKNTVNLGMTGNWNKLYLLARTEWVTMLHDDDMLYPDFYRNMANVVEHTPEAVCFYSCYNGIKDNTDHQPERTKQPIKVMTLKETDFLTGCHVHTCLGMTAKKEVIHQVGGFNPDFYPSLDYHFHVKLSHYFPIRWLRGYPIATYRWFVNAGGKEETLPGWVEKDSRIKHLVLQNNRTWVPRWMFNQYLRWFNYLYMQNWYNTFHPGNTATKPSLWSKVMYGVVKFRLGLPKKLRKNQVFENLSL